MIFRKFLGNFPEISHPTQSPSHEVGKIFSRTNRETFSVDNVSSNCDNIFVKVFYSTIQVGIPRYIQNLTVLFD